MNQENMEMYIRLGIVGGILVGQGAIANRI